MIFINLPAKDLEASKRFYAALGFELSAELSDDTSACVVIEDGATIVMLLTEQRFKGFINGEIAAAGTTEVLNGLSAASREQVDDTFERAIAGGGKPWKPATDEGPYYGRSFQDPDGHVWELVHYAQT